MWCIYVMGCACPAAKIRSQQLAFGEVNTASVRDGFLLQQLYSLMQQVDDPNLGCVHHCFLKLDARVKLARGAVVNYLDCRIHLCILMCSVGTYEPRSPEDTQQFRWIFNVTISGMLFFIFQITFLGCSCLLSTNIFRLLTFDFLLIFRRLTAAHHSTQHGLAHVATKIPVPKHDCKFVHQWPHNSSQFTEFKGYKDGLKPETLDDGNCLVKRNQPVSKIETKSDINLKSV